MPAERCCSRLEEGKELYECPVSGTVGQEYLAWLLSPHRPYFRPEWFEVSLQIHKEACASLR
jgi:hypothetical protein